MIIVTSLDNDKFYITNSSNVIDDLDRMKYKSFKDVLNSVYDYIEKYDLTRFDKMVLGQEVENKDDNSNNIDTNTDSEQFYYVTVGYYRNLSNAKNFANQLKSKGIVTTIQKGRLEQQNYWQTLNPTLVFKGGIF